APVVIASPAGTWPMASPTASGATTAMVLRSATRNGTSRGLRSIRVRSTERFLGGFRPIGQAIVGAASAASSSWRARMSRNARPEPLLQDGVWSGVREFVLRRGRVQVPALLAGAVLARGVEAVEHRREILLD